MNTSHTWKVMQNLCVKVNCPCEISLLMQDDSPLIYVLNVKRILFSSHEYLVALRYNFLQFLVQGFRSYGPVDSARQQREEECQEVMKVIFQYAFPCFIKGPSPYALRLAHS